jgi:pimeloyl-ACP methyl ester carboxylesterase
MGRTGIQSARVARVSGWLRKLVFVTAPDGRRLEVELAGPPDGMPLFVHHGTPGAAGMYEPLVQAGAERNLLHVTYSRPGYGPSDRREGRTVAECVEDVVAIADALGYERFYTAGGSGGGPHVMACAALLPERVIAACSIASPAPFDAEDLDWTEGMGQDNLDEIAAQRAGDEQLVAFLERVAAEMGAATGEQIAAVLGDNVSEPDRKVITGDFAEHLAQDTKRALSGGIWGWFDDDKAFFADWGFALSEIRAPLSLWHGGQDRFVPVAHGEWLAAHLPVRAHLLPEHGHLSLVVSSFGEILDDLLAL